MRMRILFKRVLIILSLVFFTLGVVSCTNESSKRKIKTEYYAYYGERFTLPQVADSEINVRDGKGNNVEIVMGGFTVDSTKDYTLTVKHGAGTEKATIKIIQRDKVTITAKDEYVFASLNVEKKLTTFFAVDDKANKLAYTTTLVAPDGAVVGTNLTSFIPESVGVYKLTATVESGESATAEIEVGESKTHKDLLARMGRAESKDMVVSTYGVIPSVNTEDSKFIYGAESGSLKFNSVGDAYVGGSFQLTNFCEPDISDAAGFYFFIYNDSAMDFNMLINALYKNTNTGFEGVNIVIKSREWTPIIITDYDELCSNAGNHIIRDLCSSENINGLLFNYTLHTGLPIFDFYFSDIYRIPKNDVASVNNALKELPSVSEVTLEDEDCIMEQISRVDILYNSLSKSDKAKVNYDKVNKLLQQFVWLKHPSAQKEDDVVTYFNSEVGLTQMSISVSGEGKNSITAEISSKISYGKEGKSLHLYMPQAENGRSRYDVTIQVDVPMITDFAKANDLYYCWVYNASDSEYVYYAWMDEKVGWTMPLKQGWNLLYLTDPETITGATASNARGFKILLAAAYSHRHPNGNNGNPLWNADPEMDLYISNIRALNADVIKARLNSSETDVPYLSDTITYYQLLSENSKNSYMTYSVDLANKFNDVSKALKNKLSQTTTWAVLDEQNTQIETLENSYMFAAETTRLLVIDNLDVLRAAYVNQFLTLSKTATKEEIAKRLTDCLYRYKTISSAKRANVSDEFESIYNGWLTSYGLNASETEVLPFGDKENADMQIRVRFNYPSGYKDADGNNINIAKAPNGDVSVSYTTERKYGNERGSTEIRVGTQSTYGFLSFTFTMPSRLDVSSFGAIRFYIYNDSNESYTLQKKSNGSTQNIQIKANAWTEITISISDLSANGAIGAGNPLGLTFSIYQGDWRLDNGANFYFSSVKAVE